MRAADADARGVALQVDAEPAALEADASLVTAARVNLVKNAVQASPQGSPVQVTGRLESAPGRTVFTLTLPRSASGGCASRPDPV